MSQACGALEFVLPGDLDTLTGGYIYDRRIVDGLRSRGWRVTVHSLDSSFPSPTETGLVGAASILGLLPHGAIVVVDGLALGGMPDLIAEHAGRLRFVALVHHPLGLETGLTTADQQRLDAAEAAALASVDRIIVTSRWTGRLLAERGIAKNRIAAVLPGTEPAPLAPGSGGSILNLLCVATLTQRKGHTVLFDALARLTHHEWHLYCVGSADRDAATAATLREQIVALGLTERISLLGELSKVECDRCYAGADLFVLPSFLEGYGMALAEALARGLPVVSTSAGAIPDTVPPAAGVLVPHGDSAALAKALESLMGERRKLAALKAGALLAREGLSDWDDACDRFAAELNQVA